MGPLFAHLPNETAHIYALVLTSAGIPHKLRQSGRNWRIEVPEPHRQAACIIIARYLKENRDLSQDKPSLESRHPRTYSAGYIVAILGVMHGFISPGYERRLFADSFGADAARIASGDLYRCITALMLHADWAHLLSNMVGLALFGTVVATRCGWGMGWLLILIAAAGGNLLTAMFYRYDHLSVGASTAVFAAVGLCAALTFWIFRRQHHRSWRVWTPLAGGLALLGFLGAAPYTDLMAHLLGFIAGTGLGLLYGWQDPAAKWPLQMGAAILAGGMVAASWLWGLVYSV